MKTYKQLNLSPPASKDRPDIRLKRMRSVFQICSVSLGLLFITNTTARAQSTPPTRLETARFYVEAQEHKKRWIEDYRKVVEAYYQLKMASKELSAH